RSAGVGPGAHVMTESATGHRDRGAREFKVRGQKINQARGWLAFFPRHVVGEITRFPISLVHCYSRLRESIEIVTGPSFTRFTCISVPNSPVLTSLPKSAASF